ncbi:hypothetical protein [Pontixanthobacter aquaemixtae]|uniref:Lysozyme inhibitor LprI N-terminal domain-containing protein n=1 Tax=Pontixanthobacter aquaemixtae TaxID=1958940 RepID=A0A844ZUJ4_9SPHN|nr:hypothetical protein [Pontixanthobacter aquaemixtae]MXO91653.1 hypothetical protein [Pontixanthobacter aquaemixtae]
MQTRWIGIGLLALAVSHPAWGQTPPPPPPPSSSPSTETMTLVEIIDRCRTFQPNTKLSREHMYDACLDAVDAAEDGLASNAPRTNSNVARDIANTYRSRAAETATIAMYFRIGMDGKLTRSSCVMASHAVARYNQIEEGHSARNQTAFLGPAKTRLNACKQLFPSDSLAAPERFGLMKTTAANPKQEAITACLGFKSAVGIPRKLIHFTCLQAYDSAMVLAAREKTPGSKMKDLYYAQASQAAALALIQRLGIDGEINSVSCTMAKAGAQARAKISQDFLDEASSLLTRSNDYYLQDCQTMLREDEFLPTADLSRFESGRIHTELRDKMNRESALAFLYRVQDKAYWECHVGTVVPEASVGSIMRVTQLPGTKLSLTFDNSGLVSGKTYHSQEQGSGEVSVHENMPRITIGSISVVKRDALPDGLSWSDPSTVTMTLDLVRDPPEGKRDYTSFHLAGTHRDGFGEKPYVCAAKGLT